MRLELGSEKAPEYFERPKEAEVWGTAKGAHWNLARLSNILSEKYGKKHYVVPAFEGAHNPLVFAREK